MSSKLGDLVHAEAAHLGWTGYFGRIVGAGDGPADKPAPGAVAHALEDGGIVPGRNVWYVGDAGIDVSCARNAGCVAVIVGRMRPATAPGSEDRTINSPITNRFWFF